MNISIDSAQITNSLLDYHC